MAGLLVSVRTPEEAQAALAGGADIIDIKEPTHGALGRAADAMIAAVVRKVAGRRPVSAAMGELLDEEPPYAGGLSFVKWGLARCRHLDWSRRLSALQARLSCRVVHVAYADWECAQAPSVDEVMSAACATPGNILLIDTHCKDAATLRKDRRPTLLDWLSIGTIGEVCQRCRDAEVQVALAGSLGLVEIEALRCARPTWFAVRGAACGDSERGGVIQQERVRRLAAVVK